MTRSCASWRDQRRERRCLTIPTYAVSSSRFFNVSSSMYPTVPTSSIIYRSERMRPHRCLVRFKTAVVSAQASPPRTRLRSSETRLRRVDRSESSRHAPAPTVAARKRLRCRTFRAGIRPRCREPRSTVDYREAYWEAAPAPRRWPRRRARLRVRSAPVGLHSLTPAEASMPERAPPRNQREVARNFAAADGARLRVNART